MNGGDGDRANQTDARSGGPDLMDVCRAFDDVMISRAARQKARAILAALPVIRIAIDAVRSCPRRTWVLPPSPEARDIARSVGRRHRGLLRSGVAAGLLTLPADAQTYMRGRSKQALRTNCARARAAGITCRKPSWEELPEIVSTVLGGRHDARLHHSALVDHIVRRHGEFRVAFDAKGVPVALAVVTVAVPVARLAWMLSAESDHRSEARYLLSATTFGELAQHGVEAVITDSVLLISPGSLYFQRRLGFTSCTVTVRVDEKSDGRVGPTVVGLPGGRAIR